ncbi:MAG: TlpA family protein disulfide reductase [Acidobacteria bacterium]|nr:TlpA family protein disulfide reductase [Acidobacteriota bacterium]
MQTIAFASVYRSCFRLLSLASLSLIMLVSLADGVGEAKAKIGKLPKDSVARQPMRTLDGQMFNLQDLRGKVVVLDFFAVWCGHSKQHIPTMTRFGEAEKQRGLQIIGLAAEDADTTRTRVEEFIQQMKIAYPVGLVKDEVFARFVESRDVSVPQTLIYGRDGKLVAHFAGHDATVDTELTATVKRELEK